MITDGVHIICIFLRNDKKISKESLWISIEILFKNAYEKYEKVSELYFVMGVSGEITTFLFLRTLTDSVFFQVHLVFQSFLR